MIDTYNIRFYKNNTRVAPARLDAADARLFYHQLQTLMRTYESRYSEILNEESILIVVDGRPIYRRRSRLNSNEIETIQDLMDYLGMDSTNKPKYIFANNMIVTSLDIKLSEIYVLQFYTNGK